VVNTLWSWSFGDVPIVASTSFVFACMALLCQWNNGRFFNDCAIWHIALHCIALYYTWDRDITLTIVIVEPEQQQQQQRQQ